MSASAAGPRAYRPERAWAVARRDLSVVFRSSAVLLPLIIVPLVLLVVLPAAVGLMARFGADALLRSGDLETLLRNLPPPMLRSVAGLEPVGQVVVGFLAYLFAPMFLILPLMVASVIAADSFAGEKERKTLEAVLYTPTTDLELFTGKLLAAFVPALAVTLAGLVLYATVADVAAYPYVHRLLLPNTLWMVLTLWVSPAVAGLGLGLTVVVSARVSSFQEAYQLGGVVVLPIVALVAGQAAGVLYLDVPLALLVGLGVWLLDVVLIRVGLRRFGRDTLASGAGRAS